jgi:DnaK suppressor protein
MTAAQLTRFKKLLLDLQHKLQTAGFQRIDPNRTSGETVGDNEDEQPLNEMIQSVASGRNKNHALILGQITRALAKLRDDPDDFGVCEECSEDVPLPRLNAMPYASYCVACQTKLDGPRSGPTRKKLTDYR